ncbi:oligoribonuclease [Corynebacterium sp. 320]|uniref:oligoribonuclease n=1 Tax=Corynebacterium TaxID=1716 RepID=UPI00125CAB1E|nr:MULTISPECIES: oligoribonuclease [Corynebacterium]KAB1501442.1 oligoribonuclease [Corynebacterium sp. 320]KAB1551739.1 oligoribonuclease [Corynebacterium sp. 319]KAB3525800.1 oligoribonuclease [Corynebacterium sp. 250]KAB3538734.1 oligoribonuclease [Corynebacterium sp. 366]QNP92686.1 oligoribonuclease [Corynebacterium zhongnanshanii]
MPDTPSQISKHDRIVWADCEMTGLDPERHVLVEIAVIVTDADLNPLDEGIDLVIHATDEQLAQMDDYVTTMHESNGLTEQIKASTLSLSDAEARVLDYIKQFVPVSGQAPLAGNSIGTDRLFINRYMPQLGDYLHYRMIDVSSIKELARRWYPRVYNGQPQKGMSHRALADIQESIRELEFYRQALMPAQDLRTEEVAAAAASAEARCPISGTR